MTKLELAEKIDKFLATYGKRSAWESAEWSSPDASELEAVSEYLKAGKDIPRFPWSEWGSGGYGPYSSREGREEHNEILELCKQFVKSTDEPILASFIKGKV